MYCPNCGAQVSDGARFCEECGTALGDAKAGRHASAQPARRRRRVLPLVLAAAVLVLVALYLIGTCGSGGATSGISSGDSPTQAQDAEAAGDAATTAGDDDDAAADDAEQQADAVDAAEDDNADAAAVGTDSDSDASASDSADVSAATLDDWENKACAFLNLYPANHVLVGGADDEPAPLSIEDWAASCLRYVDPDSSLGQALQDDPESLAAEMGFYEAAQVVDGVDVSAASADGVTADVTIRGTQQDWEHTLTYQRAFLVELDEASGLISHVTVLE